MVVCTALCHRCLGPLSRSHLHTRRGGRDLYKHVQEREITDGVCTEKNAATQNCSYTASASFLILQQKASEQSHTHTHTWAVDVHMNGLPDVLRLQKEQLCHYQTGVLISDLHTHTYILKLIPRPHCDSMGITQRSHTAVRVWLQGRIASDG